MPGNFIELPPDGNTAFYLHPDAEGEAAFYQNMFGYPVTTIRQDTYFIRIQSKNFAVGREYEMWKVVDADGKVGWIHYGTIVSGADAECEETDL
jgi:hypothetical protein